ncbi:hypothetical protein [uncultured Thiodictyon sp.]|uniref:hypothetical protein n=1 Tax=uncultured Thiodictyon sp. TaxID=1846217 RepID=UPI0025D5F57F|nr:hypothetical protein [uncultured Thiodictyon sp.]
MPTRNVVLSERQKLKDQSRLVALRTAVDAGLADLAEGRYRSFSGVDHLMAHLLSDDSGDSADVPQKDRGA